MSEKLTELQFSLYRKIADLELRNKQLSEQHRMQCEITKHATEELMKANEELRRYRDIAKKD